MISTRRRFSCVTFLLILLIPSVSPMLHSRESASETREESIELPKLTVKGDAICSFGFGIALSRDRATMKVKRVFITNVTPGSIAAQRGLQEGDEIIALNGENVAGMDGEIKQGKQLFALLANQELGKTIDIDVIVHVTRKVTLQATGP
jgi:C-terminal processing protease CtpA/Prc